MKACLVLVAIGLLAVTSALAQPADDKLIVPGEQIGSLRITGKLAELFTAYGRENRRGPGGWQGTIGLDWSSVGLAATADERTGTILEISIRSAGASQWSGFVTGDGIALETPQENVLEALGPPNWLEQGQGLSFFFLRPGGTTSAAVGLRSLFYLDRGIAFEIHDPGVVKEIAIHKPFRAPGDTLVVPGERISGVRLGISRDDVLRLLGGGFVETRPGEFYYWPHNGMYVALAQGRVVGVQVTTSRLAEWAKVRYATAPGLGFKSTPDQVRRMLGEPQDRQMSGRYEVWFYRALGVFFVLDHQSPEREVVIVGVEPRS